MFEKRGKPTNIWENNPQTGKAFHYCLENRVVDQKVRVNSKVDIIIQIQTHHEQP